MLTTIKVVIKLDTMAMIATITLDDCDDVTMTTALIEAIKDINDYRYPLDLDTLK